MYRPTRIWGICPAAMPFRIDESPTPAILAASETLYVVPVASISRRSLSTARSNAALGNISSAAMPFRVDGSPVVAIWAAPGTLCPARDVCSCFVLLIGQILHEIDLHSLC